MKFEKYKATNAFKLDLLSDAEFEGKYDMPVVKPVHNVEPVNLLPFHIALSNNTPDQHWYHFYEDDYQFERFWKCPSKYIPLLSRFTGGIGPDYSLYLGMPRSQQIWNCWRNKVMTFHMQKKGCWSFPTWDGVMKVVMIGRLMASLQTVFYLLLRRAVWEMIMNANGLCLMDSMS